MGKFVVKATEKGARFNLVASNGQVIATSQTYKALRSCLGGVNSVRVNAPVAAIEDQTQEDWTKEKCPKFQVYLDKAGEFRFRLLAKNGQNICHGEGYTQLRSCLSGIESVRKNAVDAEVEQAEA
ncbi:MAG: YegP family protein [Coriobacteriales bacterium]|nr:YegP family protein [Coriobacteriales bacterium]MDO5709633.1 YegP family protein [Coriobacteriales bacterium]